MALRAGLYARYSTDMQREASIEDQLRVCTLKAEQEGFKVYKNYADYGISGATLIRSGIQSLLEDARAGKIGVIITESIDRLSRDQEDIAHIYKRMTFNDIKIMTLSEGIINELHVGLKGTMGALYLKDQADKTRRGLRGRVEAGKSGGGKSYGYDVVRKMDGNGAPITGERKVNEHQAAIISRIFNAYAEGQSPRSIAVMLNSEDIPAPSGRGWGASTIHGNKERGTGLLNNDLYHGKLVWNRLRYIKDPDTGKRVSRLNPESEWVVTETPQLRIIGNDLWQAVKERQQKTAIVRGDKNHKKTGMWDRKRPKYLFSGLMTCGSCGGGMIQLNSERVGCSAARNKGTCNNRTTLRRDALEETVFDGLSKRLMDPELFEVFCKRYTARMNDLTAEHNATLIRERKELSNIDKELDKLIQAIIDGVPGSHLKDKIAALEGRKEALAIKLKASDEKPVLLHTGMADLYRKQVTNMIPLLTQDKHRARTTEIIRGLVEEIILTPVIDELTGKNTLSVSIKGHLAGILSMALNANKPLDESDLRVESVNLVAGVGFEPTTFRL
jgi:site-specific DNA recombinase